MINNTTFNFSSNISYLCPRDPSIRAGERARPKNLLFQFGESEKEIEDIVKVYLRIKPSDEDSEHTEGKLFTTVDDCRLFVDHPRDSTSSHKSDHIRHYSEQFVFTKILGGDVDQSQVFRECALQPLKNFIQGDNCLVFAYGTTNAGKTYTIRGDAMSPGIVPRALDFVFSSLGDRVLDEPSLLLVHGSHLEQLSESGTTVLLNYKRMMLEGLDQLKHCDRKFTSTMSSLHSDLSTDASVMFQDLEACMRKEYLFDWNTCELDKNAQYLVYVSFAEIYNENIYDLLQLSNPRQVCSWRRTPLQLGLDSRGNTYIKDLQHFQVTSGYEAYRIMLFGQHNLRIAGTELNSVSSRSHCIFNIKLVKCTDDLNRVRISTFSLCDLAGSERAKKTHNRGERMKESQNINTSLLVLGRCLNSIRSNQLMKEKLPVPFRDSKLTRLFKEPLLGKGCVSIIVNVNLDPYLYDETVNVLKFSAIAREVILPPRQKKKPPRMSLFAQHLQKRRQTIRESNVEESICSFKDVRNTSFVNNESLVKLVEQLQSELKQERNRSSGLVQQLRAKEHECAAKERSFALREDSLRSQLVHEFQENLKNLAAYGEATRESLEYSLEDMASFRERVAQEKYKHKLDKLKRQLKKRKFDEVEDVEEEGEEVWHERLQDCEQQLAVSRQEVNSLQAERDALRATVTLQSQQANLLQERVSRLELQLKVATASVQAEGVEAQGNLLSSLQQQLQEVVSQKVSLEEKVKLLMATVDSAAEDHEEILEEKSRLEKECYSLEKRLAEKDLEVGELVSRVNTYQTSFSKQAKDLDLLQKVSHDRQEALEKKEDHVRDLEMRLEELSLSHNKCTSQEHNSKHVDTCKESTSVDGEAQQKEVNLRPSQSLEKEMSIKEDLNNTSTQDTKVESDAVVKSEELSVLTEELDKQNTESDQELEVAAMKEQLHELQSENANLKASLAQQELKVGELTVQVNDFQTTFSQQAQELDRIHRIGREQLEAIQEKEKCVREMELKVEELCSSEEKWKVLLQELTNKNSELSEKLSETEQRRTVEVEALQKEIKDLLQRTRALETSIGEKDAELEKLQQDFKAEIITVMKYKGEVALLTEEMRKQKSDYLRDLTIKEAVMKERIEQLNVENAQLRNSITQMENEKEKQRVQHESLFKVYEDRLKQRTDEVERYKRDAHHCQDLLYKNTPTPNKETQEFIQGLKDELRKKGDQLVDLGHLVEQLKVRSVGKAVLTEGQTAQQQEVSLLRDHFEENRKPAKSTSKKNVKTGQVVDAKVRSTRRNANSESKPPTSPKTKMKLRKQLFTLDSSFVDVEDEDKWEPLHSKAKETKRKPKSPNTILKRSLRAKP